MSERPTVYLVDGTAYVYRAFYAIRQQLSTSAGVPTKAVFGFKNMLQKLVQKEKPQYLGVAFDERGPTFRHEMDPNYKANRPPMPDDLEVQIPYIHRLIEAFNIPTIRLQGFEADDILGTLARRFEAQGCDVVLVTSDKDLCQLVTEHTTILDTMKDQRFGVAEVKERFGVEPQYVVDFLGLMGDSSDNIPGVPGVGEKTARQLLGEFGNLDALLEQADAVKRPKLRESLRDNADLARQSRELATIDVQTPGERRPARPGAQRSRQRGAGGALCGTGVSQRSAGHPQHAASRQTGCGQGLPHDYRPGRSGCGNRRPATGRRLCHRHRNDQPGPHARRSRRHFAVPPAARGRLHPPSSQLYRRPDAT